MLVLWTIVLSYCGLVGGLALQMASLLRSLPRVDSSEDLDRYQRFVSVQMVGALLVLVHIPLIVAALLYARPTGLSGYAPMLIFVSVALFNKKLRALQQGCRSLPVASALRVDYDVIASTWGAKAWPRFPARSSGSVSGRSQGTADCPTHGEKVPASACVRCGTYNCEACVGSRGIGRSRCLSCHERFERIRNEGWPAERRVRVAGMALLALGISEVVWAIAIRTDLHFTPKQTLVLWIVAALGATAAVAGTALRGLWGGRTLAMLIAVMHMGFFPFGTLVAGMVIFSLANASTPHPLSASYREVISMTAPRGDAVTWISLAVAVLCVPIYVAWLWLAALRALVAFH